MPDPRPIINLNGSSSLSSLSIAATPLNVDVIEEGHAKVLFQKGKVFYNEVQVKNRDLSVLVLNAYAQQLLIESRAQAKRRKINTQWRKLPATFDTWGYDIFSHEPASSNNMKNNGNNDENGTANTEELKSQNKLERGDVEGLYILEALAATGLRSLRYAKEIISGVGVERIIVNDLEPHAVESIKRNIEFNFKNKEDSNVILVPSLGDATQVMLEHRLSASVQTFQHTRIKEFQKLFSKEGTTQQYSRNFEKEAFDVIDIDPYGSCSIFLDASVQAVRDGGLLCVTSTDLATICGKNLEVCFSKYGSMSLKAKYGHEFAIRVVLQALEAAAGRHGRYIVPLLCVQMDFYLRCFVRVYSSKAEIKKSAAKLGLVAQSSACDSFYIQPLGKECKDVHKPADIAVPSICPETGEHMKLGGPIWTAPIYNPAFVKTLMKMFKTGGVIDELASNDNLNGNVQEEEEIDVKSINPYLTHWSENELTKVTSSKLCSDKFDPNHLASAGLLKGMITAMSEELRSSDSVLYYHLPNMCKLLKTSVPTLVKFQSAIKHLGYDVSQVHCNPLGVKTNAPPEVVWDILRVWTRLSMNPIQLQELNNSAKDDGEEDTQVVNHENNAESDADDDHEEKGPKNGSFKTEAENRKRIRDLILSKEVTREVKFNPHPEILRRFRRRKNNFDVNSTNLQEDGTGNRMTAEKVTRWASNPKPHWGPKARAEGNSSLQTHKRKRNNFNSNTNGRHKRPHS